MVRIAPAPDPSDSDNFGAQARAYIRMKAAIAEMTKEANALRDAISKRALRSGDPDETGSYWLPFDDEIDGVTAFKWERRATVTVDEDVAHAILSAKGLEDRCYRMVAVLDQDEVHACLLDGLLTFEEMDEMFPAKINWALISRK